MCLRSYPNVACDSCHQLLSLSLPIVMVNRQWVYKGSHNHVPSDIVCFPIHGQNKWRWVTQPVVQIVRIETLWRTVIELSLTITWVIPFSSCILLALWSWSAGYQLIRSTSRRPSDTRNTHHLSLCYPCTVILGTLRAFARLGLSHLMHTMFPRLCMTWIEQLPL